MNKSLIEKRNILAHAFCSTIDVTKNNHMIAFNVGFELGVQAERERSKILVEALEFYALGKVDHDSQEIRDFITGKIKFNYKIADVYGCVAREALEKYKVGGE